MAQGWPLQSQHLSWKPAWRLPGFTRETDGAGAGPSPGSRGKTLGLRVLFVCDFSGGCDLTRGSPTFSEPFSAVGTGRRLSFGGPFGQSRPVTGPLRREAQRCSEVQGRIPVATSFFASSMPFCLYLSLKGTANQIYASGEKRWLGALNLWEPGSVRGTEAGV